MFTTMAVAAATRISHRTKSGSSISRAIDGLATGAAAFDGVVLLPAGLPAALGAAGPGAPAMMGVVKRQVVGDEGPSPTNGYPANACALRAV